MKPPSKRSRQQTETESGSDANESERTETETETSTPTDSYVNPSRTDCVGRKPVDAEDLVGAVRVFGSHPPIPCIDPTSLGNIARRAGVATWDIEAALRRQSVLRSDGSRVLLGQALVEVGAINPPEKAHLLKRQRKMRAGRPTFQEALDVAQQAIDRTLQAAGLRAELALP